MEPSEVRSRVAIAVGLKLGVDHEKARVVGDVVLRVIQECGLITLPASELARVNEMVRVGMEVNVGLIAALQKIASMDDGEFGLDAARDIAMRAITTEEAPMPSMREITALVAERHGVPIYDMYGECRERKAAWARQEAFALMRAEGRYSFPQIGQHLNRDHSTVIKGIRRYEARVEAARRG